MRVLLADERVFCMRRYACAAPAWKNFSKQSSRFGERLSDPTHCVTWMVLYRCQMWGSMSLEIRKWVLGVTTACFKGCGFRMIGTMCWVPGQLGNVAQSFTAWMTMRAVWKGRDV